jgi:hypothetical protein
MAYILRKPDTPYKRSHQELSLNDIYSVIIGRDLRILQNNSSNTLVELKILQRTFIQKNRKSWGLECKLLGQTYAEHQKKLGWESEAGMATRS